METQGKSLASMIYRARTVSVAVARSRRVDEDRRFHYDGRRRLQLLASLLGTSTLKVKRQVKS
jgi:hypothetical protein